MTASLRREPNTDTNYGRRARAVVAAGGQVERAEHGGYVSVHYCATCGDRFTVCPPSSTFGSHCLSTACPSYDPARDAEQFFAPDDPALIEKAP